MAFMNPNAPAIKKDNGMGLIRYILALAVFTAHFSILTGADFYFPVSSYHAVGGFFALSGFLVYGSYLRSPSLTAFVAKRARKILPPYIFIVSGCALLLGFTVQPSDWQFYFGPEWWKYLGANLTFLNFLAPSLPGVFGGEAVNGSLWTIKVEWALYLSVPAVVWLISKTGCRSRSREWPVYVIIYVISALYRLAFKQIYEMTEIEIYNILSRQFFGQLCFFYTGVFVYRNYAAFMRHRTLWTAAGIAALFSADFIPMYSFFIEPAALGVSVIGLSMTCGHWISLFNANNVSYEIYLFHWPIILLVAQYRECFDMSYATAFFASIMCTVLLSILCWKLIDKPILRH